MSPRVAAIALAALLLGGAGVAAAISHDDDGDADEAAAVVTTSTVEPTETTATSAPAQPTSTAGVAPTVAGATTTIGARPAPTTRPPTSTTSTTTGDCTAPQIQVTATTDKTAYGAGQQVQVDSTLRNRSQSACFYAGHTFQVTIQDAVGRPIISFEVVTPGPERSTFVPGATLSGSVPWDQRSCQTQPCPQPPPGPYSAAVKWIFAGGPYEARAAFSLAP